MLEFKGPKLTTTLICQAPMIHFQHYEKGATLRASEVKPKFDRYLIKKVGWQELKKFRIGTEGQALDYKIRIVDDKLKEPHDIPRNFIFYGNRNNAPDREMKKLVYSNPTLTVTCFNKELQKIIKKHLENFFLVTNFGTMQSKGFGSFSVKDSGIANIEEVLMSEFKIKSLYYMEFKSDDNLLKFKKIKDFYSQTKSGINGRNADSPYVRSSLVKYMHKQGIGNEKAFAKQKKLLPRIGKSKADNSKKFMYIRSLLGVGASMKDVKINHVLINNDGSIDNRSDKYKKQKIERMQSTIFFKILHNKVYIIPLEVPERIYGKYFALVKNRNWSKDNLIQTPLKEDFEEGYFETKAFLDYAVDCYNKNVNYNGDSNQKVLFNDFVEIKNYNPKGGNT